MIINYNNNLSVMFNEMHLFIIASFIYFLKNVYFLNIINL